MADLTDARIWLDPLRARDAGATERLHELLLRAARFEIGRRRASLPHLRGDEFDDIAHQSANDALVAVLRKLDTFRGDSSFTTWAYKFALLEAAVSLRRRAWQGRELPLTAQGLESLAGGGEPGDHGELLAALRDAIAAELSPQQRDVLVAVALNDVPIDVLAERRATTRGALYKTLHDARRKLRACLEQQGFDLPGASNG